MRRIVGVATLLIALVIGQAAEASLIVDVTGTAGIGITTWTFSGSYTIGDVSQTPDVYSMFGGHLDDNNINNFTHDTGELIGGDISVADNTFNLQDFGLLSSTAQILGSASGLHALDGIFLDSDSDTLDDDFIWYAVGTFEDGETLTFEGAATIGIDINSFLAAGEEFRSISSLAATAGNPADFTMNFSRAAAVSEPSSLMLLATSLLGLVVKRRQRL